MTTPTRWQRLEGAVALALCLLLYADQAGGWLLFAALFLLPDLSMLGYIKGPVFGAAAYNLFHTYGVSLLVALLGILLSESTLVTIALVWTAHIGFDRMLGFGLKLPDGFKHTHLGVMSQQTGSPT